MKFFCLSSLNKISLGGHLNPAVTLAMTVTKRLHWKKLPVYWLAQSIGAFVASAIVYAVYYGKFSFTGKYFFNIFLFFQDF